MISGKHFTAGILTALAGAGLIASVELGVLSSNEATVSEIGILLLFALGRAGSPTWKQFTARCLLSLTSASLIVPTTDLLLRQFDDATLRKRPWPKLHTVMVYEANANCKTTLVGGLAMMCGESRLGEPRRIVFQTDASGFRNAPATDTRPFDLVLLGDSFTAGAYTSQEDIFATQIARQSGWRVLNLGIGGGGPWAHLMYLRGEFPQRSIRRGATLVWCLYTGNDLIDPYGPLDDREIPWSDPATARRIERNHIREQSALAKLFRQASVGTPHAHLVVKVPGPFGDGPLFFYSPNREQADLRPEDVRNRPEYPYLRQTITALRDFAADHDLVVKVVLIPCKEEVYGWLLESEPPWTTRRERSAFSIEVEQILIDNELEFHDLKPDFFAAAEQAFSQGKLLWWRDDTHINGAGHALIASRILSLLDSSHTDDPAHVRAKPSAVSLGPGQLSGN